MPTNSSLPTVGSSDSRDTALDIHDGAASPDGVRLPPAKRPHSHASGAAGPRLYGKSTPSPRAGGVSHPSKPRRPKSSSATQRPRRWAKQQLNSTDPGSSAARSAGKRGPRRRRASHGVEDSVYASATSSRSSGAVKGPSSRRPRSQGRVLREASPQPPAAGAEDAHIAATGAVGGEPEAEPRPKSRLLQPTASWSMRVETTAEDNKERSSALQWAKYGDHPPAAPGKGRGRAGKADAVRAPSSASSATFAGTPGSSGGRATAVSGSSPGVRTSVSPINHGHQQQQHPRPTSITFSPLHQRSSRSRSPQAGGSSSRAGMHSRSSLARSSVFTAGSAAESMDPFERMRRQGAHLMKGIERYTNASDHLEKQIAAVVEQIESTRHATGGADHTTFLTKAEKRLRKTWVGRIDVLKTRISQEQTTCAKLKADIDSTRRAKANIITDHKRTKAQLEEVAQQSAEAKAEQKQLAEQRFGVMKELTELKKKLERQVQQINAACLEFDNNSDMTSLGRNFLIRQRDQRKAEEEERQRRLNEQQQSQKASTKRAWEVALETATLKATSEKVGQYKRNLSSIFEAAGESNLRLLLSRYKTVEEDNFKRFCMLNQECELVEELLQRVFIKRDGISQYLSKSRRAQPKWYHLAKSQERSLRARLKHLKQRVEEEKQCAAGIEKRVESLFHACGCDPSSVQGLAVIPSAPPSPAPTTPPASPVKEAPGSPQVEAGGSVEAPSSLMRETKLQRRRRRLSVGSLDMSSEDMAAHREAVAAAEAASVARKGSSRQRTASVASSRRPRRSGASYSGEDKHSMQAALAALERARGNPIESLKAFLGLIVLNRRLAGRDPVSGIRITPSSRSAGTSSLGTFTRPTTSSRRAAKAQRRGGSSGSSAAKLVVGAGKPLYGEEGVEVSQSSAVPILACISARITELQLAAEALDKKAAQTVGIGMTPKLVQLAAGLKQRVRNSKVRATILNAEQLPSTTSKCVVSYVDIPTASGATQSKVIFRDDSQESLDGHGSSTRVVSIAELRSMKWKVELDKRQKELQEQKEAQQIALRRQLAELNQKQARHNAARLLIRKMRSFRAKRAADRAASEAAVAEAVLGKAASSRSTGSAGSHHSRHGSGLSLRTSGDDFPMVPLVEEDYDDSD